MPQLRAVTVGLIATVALVATACGTDGPTQPPQAARAPLTPSPIGVFSAADNPFPNYTATATFTITPNRDTYVLIGPHFLYIPANALCEVLGSGYGVGTWEQPCKPALSSLTITASATLQDGHPLVSFDKHVRFQPTDDARRWVMLYMRDDNASSASQITWCPAAEPGRDAGACVDETRASRAPWQLKSTYDYFGRYVYRRIEHFSGYNVTAGRDSTDNGGGL